jgi:uncharacterized protein YbjT (DUF2867 family)
VVQQLRDDGIPVRAMTRNPATITPTEQVDAVLGDFQDPATTAAGLHGVDAIFVMSPVASIVDHTKIAVDVARRGGRAVFFHGKRLGLPCGTSSVVRRRHSPDGSKLTRPPFSKGLVKVANREQS